MNMERIRNFKIFTSRPDLILMHPPSVFKFREQPVFFGPVSDVVPSSSLFEIYPIGFLTISEYLQRHGISVRIINMAMKMLNDPSFDPEKFIARLNPAAFGIDLHWLPHVDGSLSLAEMVKKQHPDKPVIFGGLSSTYFHREIMTDYPFVDFIVCGDSTEEPLRMLMNAIKNGGDYRHIPNLVWRNSNGEIVKNEISHRPPDLDTLRFDYSHLLKMALRYRDPSGYIPFRHWLSYPVSAVFQCRGCFHNCASCGGSLSSFKKLCMRDKPSFRSPELLAEDIRRTADLTGAPIFVIGDLLQAGEEYASRFLETIKGYHVRNGITLEFFVPPPEAFLERVAASIENFNIEMSPESHDPKIRKIFGKTYSNEELEEALEIFIKHGCTRVDLFFMVGLPYQDYASIMETVAYCERLLGKCRSPQKLLPMISPLAPFIDPGSNIFENPEKFGYRLFYQTLREHREASLKPSWKYTLNYETTWMTRDDIVRATYDSASMLTDIKAKYGIIGKEKARAIVEHIKRAKDLIARIDRSEIIDDSLKTEIMNLNTVDSLCDKHELEWPVKGARLNVFNVLRMLLFRPPRIACAE